MRCKQNATSVSNNNKYISLDKSLSKKILKKRNDIKLSMDADHSLNKKRAQQFDIND